MNNKTPNLGLNYGSDAAGNWNLSKLDQAIGTLQQSSGGGGGAPPPMRLVTASDTVLPTDATITIQVGDADIHLALPPAASVLGTAYSFYRIDDGSGFGSCFIDCAGTDLIYSMNITGGNPSGQPGLQATYMIRAVAAGRWQGGNFGVA